MGGRAQAVGGSGGGETGKPTGGEMTQWQGSKWALASSGWPGVVRGRSSKWWGRKEGREWQAGGGRGDSRSQLV